MINLISKYRRTDKVRGSKGTRKSARSSDLPLDKQLTYKPSPDEQWSYEEDGRVHVNGVDIEEMVEEERNDVKFLCGVSHGLDKYQHFVWSKGGKGECDFNAKVRSIQDKVHGRLNTIYDDLTGGVRFELQNGEFWINNINVRKTIVLFYHHPTEAARRYLMTLRDKLDLILSSRHASKRYDGVHEYASALFKDINLALEYIPTDAPPRLVGRVRHA
ncbi:MAG: hypothetical protein HN337_02360 [Deltaproteobacteria bacterium]|jgi:hypothetical protein|nr:hypothetical protein [Deltaproteobacteria bacterium]